MTIAIMQLLTNVNIGPRKEGEYMLDLSPKREDLNLPYILGLRGAVLLKADGHMKP